MGKEIDRELKRGTLDMILLKLISERPMYGYELISTLESRGGEQFQLKEGTLYPVLYRLEEAGWIEARWETFERGAPRKYYHMTVPGESQLAAWIRGWHNYVSAVNRILAPGETGNQK